MSQSSPKDKTKFDRKVKLEVILSTPDDSDIGYFINVDVSYPDNEKEKNNKFPFCS